MPELDIKLLSLLNENIRRFRKNYLKQEHTEKILFRQMVEEMLAPLLPGYMLVSKRSLLADSHLSSPMIVLAFQKKSHPRPHGSANLGGFTSVVKGLWTLCLVYTGHGAYTREGAYYSGVGSEVEGKVEGRGPRRELSLGNKMHSVP